MNMDLETLIIAAVAARLQKQYVRVTPAGSIHGRQLTAAKGTGVLPEKNLNKHLPHVGNKQIQKELKRREKQNARKG